ncbi:transposase [Streptomyces mirabilis]
MLVEGEGSRDLIRVAGDGDCFFASVLVGWGRQFVLERMPAAGGAVLVDVAGLRGYVAGWMRGEGNGQARQVLDVQSAVGVLAGDLRGRLSEEGLRMLVGLYAESDDLGDLADVLWGALAGERGEEVWRGVVLGSLPGLGAVSRAEFLGMSVSELVALAVERREMWSTPFGEYVLEMTAGALGRGIGIVQPRGDGGYTAYTVGGGGDPLFVFYNGKDHYDALGLPNPSALRGWIRQAEADAGERDDRLTTDERAELAALRKENVQLKRANEVLRTASAFFAAPTRPGPGDGAR